MEKHLDWIKTETKLCDKYYIYDIYKNHWVNLAENKSGDFYQMKIKDWVIVFAQTKNKKWILVEQFRFGSESASIEFPAGVIDADEDPLIAGKRELKEETGYEGENPVNLGWAHPNPALCNNKCHFIYLRNALKVSEQNLDENEVIKVELASMEEIHEKIQSSAIHHGMVHAGLYLLAQYLKK